MWVLGGHRGCFNILLSCSKYETHRDYLDNTICSIGRICTSPIHLLYPPGHLAHCDSYQESSRSSLSSQACPYDSEPIVNAKRQLWISPQLFPMVFFFPLCLFLFFVFSSDPSFFRDGSASPLTGIPNSAAVSSISFLKNLSTDLAKTNLERSGRRFRVSSFRNTWYRGCCGNLLHMWVPGGVHVSKGPPPTWNYWLQSLRALIKTPVFKN